MTIEQLQPRGQTSRQSLEHKGRKPKPSFHDHRKRLRKRFAESGPESFLDHELLEMILACVIARKDTKDMAWDLLRKFKNLAGVFEASSEELLAVCGIGPKSAQLLTLFRPACAAYLKSRLVRRSLLNSPQLTADYCRLRLAGKSHELAYVLYVNDRNRLLAEKTVSLGSVNESPVYPRRVVEEALACRASGFILVHNHPSGEVTPSPEDRTLTERILQTARSVDLRFLDHIIVGQNGHYSFRETGFFEAHAK
ncbi:MAG: DNA repair protein RadC [Elusimicrobia bacterium]|nr:DNA repair protein RadC [Elusimicrobiota bacterium]